MNFGQLVRITKWNGGTLSKLLFIIQLCRLPKWDPSSS